MKKLISVLMVALVLMVTFAACKQEEDPYPFKSEGFSGDKAVSEVKAVQSDDYLTVTITWSRISDELTTGNAYQIFAQKSPYDYRFMKEVDVVGPQSEYEAEVATILALWGEIWASDDQTTSYRFGVIAGNQKGFEPKWSDFVLLRNPNAIAR
ncbi:MAG: hypothetical protein LBB81_00815 [Treponema sp.]|jgi:hypothetical protein|nr:hypothetical protein [Treponema sp.]